MTDRTPPIYIPSKGRATIARTPASLDEIGRTYLIIVEDQQYDDYAAVYGESKLLVLDKTFQDDYETLDSIGTEKPVGAGRHATLRGRTPSNTATTGTGSWMTTSGTSSG